MYNYRFEVNSYQPKEPPLEPPVEKGPFCKECNTKMTCEKCFFQFYCLQCDEYVDLLETFEEEECYVY